MTELEILYDSTAAQLACGRLRAAGIDAQLFDASIASLIGPGLSGIRLMVDADQADDARALLAALAADAV